MWGWWLPSSLWGWWLPSSSLQWCCLLSIASDDEKCMVTLLKRHLPCAHGEVLLLDLETVLTLVASSFSDLPASLVRADSRDEGDQLSCHRPRNWPHTSLCGDYFVTSLHQLVHEQAYKQVKPFDLRRSGIRLDVRVFQRIELKPCAATVWDRIPLSQWACGATQ